MIAHGHCRQCQDDRVEDWWFCRICGHGFCSMDCRSVHLSAAHTVLPDDSLDTREWFTVWDVRDLSNNERMTAPFSWV
jgi:hypothetical protein